MVNKADKPETETKAIVAPKQRYFVPELGETVEATDLAEVEKIVQKRKADEAESNKG